MHIALSSSKDKTATTATVCTVPCGPLCVGSTSAVCVALVVRGSSEGQGREADCLIGRDVVNSDWLRTLMTSDALYGYR